ncbi:CrcB protein [Cytobacillus eiseniae]|uniref:Fluoride-specific ion channel FluC n=1 Tax=Cytobacillus eiseniae TaxID=762947 RepID=A0ABS4RBN3_9BACI|nr:fluoride efflux transporter CrcB [Cytobacillus eiseniae]MBP2239744.1 CrcB protein [Cytobacillus eiseniae]
MAYFLIGIGGMFGSILRYSFSFFNDSFKGDSFPFGTLIANILGAFLLGYFTRKMRQKKQLNQNLILFISTGLLGSFTTFSALSLETVILFQSGAYFYAFLYVMISMIGGLAAASIGYFDIRRGGKV